MAALRQTYRYKLYNSKQNKYLDHAIDIACEIWNHCPPSQVLPDVRKALV